MKTIQMTIDATLLDQVDDAIRELNTSRSAFIRESLQAALRQLQVHRLETRQAAGYARSPIQSDEFDGWEAEQVWGAE